jgi:NAD(P)-dependent dehydrogenase (short-subunit alcohol dehydrogenase family)
MTIFSVHNSSTKGDNMQKILITGCSSGFGLETARYFLEHGWEVIATMRTPRKDALPPSEHLRVLRLDVTDTESIREAVETAGQIDALVNNAGFGLLSVLEGTPMETVRALFETNTFGAMAVTQAFLPQLRKQKAGVIVNVSSSVTLRPLPMLAVYTASKAAMNAFTESLALELQPFNVRVRIVLPGRSPETAFGQNAQAQTRKHGVAIPEPYSDLARTVFERMGQTAGPVTRSLDVAQAVWRAVTDPSCPLRLPAGQDAVEWARPSL